MSQQGTITAHSLFAGQPVRYPLNLASAAYLAGYQVHPILSSQPSGANAHTRYIPKPR